MRRYVYAGACALLLAATALAMPATGDLELSGTILTPPGTRATIPLDAALLFDTRGLAALHLEADVLTVRRLATTSADLDTPAQRLQFATGGEDVLYDLTGATVDLSDAQPDGWLGLVGDGISALALVSGAPLSTRGVVSPVLATGGPSDADDVPYFRAERAGPLVRVDGAGAMVYDGPLKLKLGGPDVRVVARENTTTLRTGTQREEGPVAGSEIRWVVLESPRAIFRLDSAVPLDILASRASLAWDGGADLSAASGEIETPDGVLVADGAAARLDGSLTLDLRPGQNGELLGSLQGELRSSSLAAVGARVPMEQRATTWMVATLGTILFGAVLVALLVRRRNAQPHLEADDCLEMAHLALAVDRTDDARLWLARARKLSPASGRLMLEEGQLFERMGRHDASLRAYAQAEHAMPTRGDADLAIARLLHATGAARAEAETRLSRALEKSPLLLLEIEADDRLQDLLHAPQVRSALRTAREALE